MRGLLVLGVALAPALARPLLPTGPPLTPLHLAAAAMREISFAVAEQPGTPPDTRPVTLGLRN